MKILDKVEEVFSEYSLTPLELPDGHNVYTLINEYPENKIFYESEKDDTYFINKYHQYIPRGWYGFSLGNPIIPEWMEIIDKVLEICVEADPNFEIHQIKLKFGSICFYVGSEVIEDIHEVEMKMYDLSDPALIY
jgi:hypothetical protein